MTDACIVPVFHLGAVRWTTKQVGVGKKRLAGKDEVEA